MREAHPPKCVLYIIDTDLSVCVAQFCFKHDTCANKQFLTLCRFLMTMEAGADTQQSGDTAVSDSEAQQITLAQVKLVINTNVTK